MLYFLYSWGYAIWFCKFYRSGSWLAIELFLNLLHYSLDTIYQAVGH